MNQRSRLLVHLFFLSALLILFVYLAAAVSSGDVSGLDSSIREAIHGSASARLTSAAAATTFLGSVPFLMAASAVALLSFYRVGFRRDASVVAWVMGGSVVLDNALKFAVHRMRPVPFFGTAPESYSFPSGHALFSCCFYVALAGALASHSRSGLLRAGVWLAAVLLVIAIGLSRIYLGFHYPSDVLGGYIAACFWIHAVLIMGHLGILPKRDP